MDVEHLIYEKEGRVATLTLNRPNRGNALCRALRDEMDLVLDGLDSDDDTRVLVRVAGTPTRPGRPARE